MAVATPEQAVDRRKIKSVRISGCTASALAAKYADVDVVTAFPIRPYTAIMMQLAQMIANGELDAEFIHADGEHSQLSAAHGAASCGARAFTGSSGVGVTYAYEEYSIISGSRVPVHMAIADRTLDPPGDFGSEHTDALCTRDMGWLMGWAESPQEVFDKHLMAFRIGEDHRVLLPQMVCQDGYFVSHISGDVDLPDQSLVDEFLPPYKLPYALDPRRPVSHGPQIMPEQGPSLQLGRAAAMEGAVPVIREITDRFGEMFGRKYQHFVETYKVEDAEAVFFMQGAHSVTARAAVDHAREAGHKIGVARLLWVRPFPTEDIQKLLGHVKAIGVVETNLALGGATSGGSLALDLCTALYPLRERPVVTSFMAGMGGETIPMHEFEWMINKLVKVAKAGEIEKMTHWVGFED
jgi:pyruvate ferredoxin oxidoreductase alpha subunit/oxalate oxidoreductase subunit alpha